MSALGHRADAPALRVPPAAAGGLGASTRHNNATLAAGSALQLPAQVLHLAGSLNAEVMGFLGPASMAYAQEFPFHHKFEVYREKDSVVVSFVLRLEQPFLAEEFEKSSFVWKFAMRASASSLEPSACCNSGKFCVAATTESFCERATA